VFSYSEVEKLVRTATSNEPWGASEDLKLKIADATYDLYARTRTPMCVYCCCLSLSLCLCARCGACGPAYVHRDRERERVSE
jgi:hypothetical protein